MTPQLCMAGTYAKITARGQEQQSGRRTDCSARPPTDPDVRDSRIRLLKHHHSLAVLLSLCRACLVRPFVGSNGPSGRSAHCAMMPGSPFPTAAPLGLGSPLTHGTTDHSDVCCSVSASSGCPLSADTLRCPCSSAPTEVSGKHHLGGLGELITRSPLTT